MIPAQRINALGADSSQSAAPPNLGVASFVNSNGLLKQTNDNYSGRVDYMATPSLNLFGRYSMANEDAIIPATVTGRDNVNDVRPQNFVVGVTKTLRPTLVNEVRVAFSRFRQINGLPELDFNVERHDHPPAAIPGVRLPDHGRRRKLHRHHGRRHRPGPRQHLPGLMTT